MDYTIHLYVPKTGRLTPAMLEWYYRHGSDPYQPEAHHPFRKIVPKTLARFLLKLDPSLIPERGEEEDVALVYPLQQLGLRLYIHERGVVLMFPLMGGGLARIILGICYTYSRFLYEAAGFWSYDPHLNVISYADDYQSIDETAALMESLLPRLLDN